MKIIQAGRKTHARLETVIRRGYDYDVAILKTGNSVVIQTEYKGEPRLGKIHSRYASPMCQSQVDQWNLMNPKQEVVLKNIRAALAEECVRLWGDV